VSAHRETHEHAGLHRRPRIYGLMAEFDTPGELVEAAHKARGEGYRRMDAYSPYPIEELAEALHFHDNRLPIIVLVGGLVGAIGGYLMQYFASVIDYPLNIGGRPMHSWPSFIPVTFELTILIAAFAAVFGMLALNHLPMPYHPVFNVPEFAAASRNRFFLCIEARDPKFDLDATAEFLEGLAPREVHEVSH
jgi:hypothetical protein